MTSHITSHQVEIEGDFSVTEIHQQQSVKGTNLQLFLHRNSPFPAQAGKFSKLSLHHAASRDAMASGGGLQSRVKLLRELGPILFTGLRLVPAFLVVFHLFLHFFF